MIALHTVYVVTLVSQTTSASILWLLAGGDRRSRGLVPLASACTLHTMAIILMPMWRGSNRWVPLSISSAILPVMFYLIYQGLSRFLKHREKDPLPALATVIACAALAAAAAPWSRLWSIQIAWVTAMVVMACTAKMLWRPRNAALCLPARVTAVFLSTILLTFALRLPLEPHRASSPLMTLLRELAVIEITLLAFSFLAIYLAETKRRHYEETRRDVLTGLLNRRALEEIATSQIRTAHRSRQALALLMMDLDAFKLLNDTWGHVIGDRALQAVGKILHVTAQHPGNTVARLGGEEFAVLLPACPLPEAKKLAELLRSAVASIRLPAATRQVTLTVSIGLTTCHPGETSWPDMLHRADVALYRAKRAGRNRVVVCDTSEEMADHGDGSTRDSQTIRNRTTTPSPRPSTSTANAGTEEKSSV